MKNNLLRSVKIKNLNDDEIYINTFFATSLFEITSAPVNSCGCFQDYKPVECSDGKIYNNWCYAGCSGQTKCTETFN